MRRKWRERRQESEVSCLLSWYPPFLLFSQKVHFLWWIQSVCIELCCIPNALISALIKHMDKIWPPFLRKWPWRWTKDRFGSIPTKQVVVLENTHCVTVAMPYLIFIITLQGDYNDYPNFQKISLRVLKTWRITLGQALRVGQWQNNPNSRTGHCLLC